MIKQTLKPEYKVCPQINAICIREKCIAFIEELSYDGSENIKYVNYMILLFNIIFFCRSA